MNYLKEFLKLMYQLRVMLKIQVLKKFKDGMDVTDLIFLGGGFNDDSHLSDIF